MDGFAYQGVPKVRQVRVGTSETQGSDGLTTAPTCRGAVVKASAANVGIVYVAFATGVLAEQTATSDLVGFPLAAGEETPVLTVASLDEIYMLGTDASDDVMILYATTEDSL